MGSKTKIAIILIIVGALAISSALTVFPNKKTIQKTTVNRELPIIEPYPMFFEKNNFEQAVSAAQDVVPQDDIEAIIVPQHLLASELIAQQLKRASGRDIETVVIVGPNHFNTGTEEIASSNSVWQTDFGKVYTNYDLTSKFLKDLVLLDSSEVFIKEHSIGSAAPFVKYYLPEAKILPIAFNSYANLEDVYKVSDWLRNNLPAKSLIIYSIDFSHYLTREQADLKDKETKQLIENNDIAKIMTLGNDHLDSPATLSLALLSARNSNLYKNILEISNSDDFSLERTAETTSYFVITISREELKVEPAETSLIFVGDIMLSRSVGDMMIKQKDFAWPFRNIYEYISSADISFGNLEGPISDKGKDRGNVYSFRADPKAIEGLNLAGLDVVSVANNHIGDWGLEAASDTLKILKENNIAYAGGGFDNSEAHSAKIIERNNLKFGFLAYSQFSNTFIKATDKQAGITDFSKDKIISDIASAKKIADIVIVSYHFGEEYDKDANDKQVELAHLAIDNGASLVIGHHPHVVQNSEKYKDGYIVYSLGNFVFDQGFSAETMEGRLLKVVFKDKAIDKVEELSIKISNLYQASLAK